MDGDDAILVVEATTQRVLDGNPYALRLTKRTLADLQSGVVADLLQQERGAIDWAATVQQPARFNAHDGMLLRTGADGATIPISLLTLPMHADGMAPLALFLIRDRRQDMAAYRRLRRTEAELRRVLVSSSDCLWSSRIDSTGRWRYRYVSPVVQKIAGRNVDFIFEEPLQWGEIVALPDQARWQKFHADITSGNSADLEYRLLKPNGQFAWVRESVVVTRLQDHTLFLHGVLSDVTHRKQVEQAHLERNLLETQKLESLGVLAGGIAHDFNNLLTGILGNASLARLTAPDNAALVTHLEQIETIAVRAADLCKQMLAYAGKARFIVEAADLNQLILQTKDLLSLSISKKTALTLNLAKDVPTVLVDATQIRQILMNLVINASEAFDQNEGEIDVTTGVVHVKQDLSRSDFETMHEGSPSGVIGNVILPPHMPPELPVGDYVFMEVQDNGPGMPPDVKKRIFEPFFTTKFTGRGLGLAAVLGIVRGHQGAIQVISEPGRGTTFRIFLPCTDALVKPARAATPPPPSWRGEGLVLVVDDEESVRRVASAMVESLGFTVLQARDGMEALEIFKDQGHGIDVVLLDLTMPRLGGEETLQELRKLQPELPIVVMSGYSEIDARGRFSDEGPSAYLQKPFRIVELIRVLRPLAAHGESLAPIAAGAARATT